MKEVKVLEGMLNAQGMKAYALTLRPVHTVLMSF